MSQDHVIEELEHDLARPNPNEYDPNGYQPPPPTMPMHVAEPIPQVTPVQPLGPTQPAFVRPTLAPTELGAGPQAKRSRLMNFSGVRSEDVTVPGERTLYTAAAISMMAYGVYAFLGTIFFTMMAIGQNWAGLIGGLVGLVIVAINISIDRGIVGYVPAKVSNLASADGDASPIESGPGINFRIGIRVFIALLFAIAVSEPVTMMLFNKDIQAEMARETDAAVSTKQASQNEYFSTQEQTYLKQAQDAQAQIDAIRAAPGELQKEAMAESQGSGATGESGCGTVCKQKLEQANAKQASMDADLAPWLAQLNSANESLSRLAGTKADGAAQTQAQAQADNGYLARKKAFYSYLGKNKEALFSYIVIALLFLSLEMVAVITKVLTKGNNYERAQARRARMAELTDQWRMAHHREVLAESYQTNRRLKSNAIQEFEQQHYARSPLGDQVYLPARVRDDQ